MFRRTFQGNAPHITFTRNWQQVPFGNLVPGRTVLISYDPHRLGFPPPQTVTAFCQFSLDGPVQSKQLDSPSGMIVTRIADDPYEANYLATSIDIPEDADLLILWFAGDGQWDSDHGANYWFRFTSLDIQGENATVTPGGFEVSLTALPEVEDVFVHFKVINNDQFPAGSLPLTPGDRTWKVDSVPVPPGANVRFEFTYRVHGRTFRDDNDGTGFFAPKPESTHDPRKYAVARAGVPSGAPGSQPGGGR